MTGTATMADFLTTVLNASTPPKRRAITSQDDETLVQAIQQASQPRLASTLLALLECPQAKAIIEGQLLLNCASLACSPTSRKRALESSASPRKAQKRIRYQTCTQCKKEFDASNNSNNACKWHPGELVLHLKAIWSNHHVLDPAPGCCSDKQLGELELDHDSSTWDDWDESWCPEKDTMADEMPEGFLWTCCDEDGLAEGCNTTRHTTVHLEA